MNSLGRAAHQVFVMAAPGPKKSLEQKIKLATPLCIFLKTDSRHFTSHSRKHRRGTEHGTNQQHNRYGDYAQLILKFVLHEAH